MQGIILDEKSAKKFIRDNSKDSFGNNTWNSLYGSINKAENAQLLDATYDYSQIINDAYKASFDNKQSVYASNLGQGYKQEQVDMIDEALAGAYDSYRANYDASLAQIGQQAETSRQGITSILDTQAKMSTLYANSTFDYLNYLYKWYQDNESDTVKNIFTTEENWKKFVNEKGELLSKEELTSRMYDLDETTGMYTLNRRGRDFYDQMFNAMDYEGRGVGFNSWLASQNDEGKYKGVYDWSTSMNMFNEVDKNKAGLNTNSASTRVMLGLASDDEEYQFLERFGGLNKKEARSLFNGLNSKMEELANIGNPKDNAFEITTKLYEINTEINDLSERLGIKQDLNKEIANLNITDANGHIISTWEDFNKFLQETITAVASGEDVAADWFARVTAMTVAGAGTGAAAGTIIPGAGNVAGTLIGTIVGFIGGIIDASVSVDDARKQNEKVSNNVKQQVQNIINTMVYYSNRRIDKLDKQNK